MRAPLSTQSRNGKCSLASGVSLRFLLVVFHTLSRGSFRFSCAPARENAFESEGHSYPATRAYAEGRPRYLPREKKFYLKRVRPNEYIGPDAVNHCRPRESCIICFPAVRIS